MKTKALSAALIVAFMTTACATTTTQERQYMAIGAGAGIVTVALLGTPFSGVVVGAAAGGAAGYAYSQHSGSYGRPSDKSESARSSKSDPLRNPYQAPQESACIGKWMWNSQTGSWVCK
jgi:phage tail tape-measure protein